LPEIEKSADISSKLSAIVSALQVGIDEKPF